MAATDIDLVTLAKAAPNGPAFEDLLRRHQAPLRAFLRRVCGDAALADDLAQETMLKAFRNLVQFEGGASFRSWLFAIAMREMLQEKRRERARDELTAQHEDDAFSTANSGAIDAGDMSIDLQKALGRLSEQERAAILLCDAVGFSHGEASTALNVPLGSLKTYVARAREKLRAALSQSPPINGADTNPKFATETSHARS